MLICGPVVEIDVRFVLFVVAAVGLGLTAAALVFIVPSACTCTHVSDTHFMEVTLEPTPYAGGYHFLSQATNRGEGAFLPPNGTWSSTLVVTDSAGTVVHRETARADRVTRFSPGEAVEVMDTYWNFAEPYPVGPGTYHATVTLDAGFMRATSTDITV